MFLWCVLLLLFSMCKFIILYSNLKLLLLVGSAIIFPIAICGAVIFMLFLSLAIHKQFRNKIKRK
jgi:hypothetical protein